MASVDLVDETFIAAPPATIATIAADEARWRQWWPDLVLTVFMDRGSQGIRWSATGALVGSVELWLESFGDGTIVHYYLRGIPASPASPRGAELPDTPSGWRRAAQLRQSRAKDWKRTIWALKDEVEGTREAGMPSTTTSLSTPERSTGGPGREALA